MSVTAFSCKLKERPKKITKWSIVPYRAPPLEKFAEKRLIVPYRGPLLVPYSGPLLVPYNETPLYAVG